MSEQIDRLGRQLDAISDALVVASKEHDPEERARLLAVVERAHGAALKEYEAVRRSRFRLLKGGLSAAGITALASHARKHPAALAAVSAATIAAAVLGTVITLDPGGEPPSAGRPPSASTTVAPPSADWPRPSADGTPAPGQTSAAPPTASTPPTRIPAPSTGGRPPPVVTVIPADSISPAPATVPPPSPPGTATPTTAPPTTGPPTTSAPPPPTPPPPTSAPPVRPPPDGGLCLHVGLPPLLNVGICL